MEEKLRAHVEMLFENAPNTRKAIELKEELLANSKERYQDLLADGFSPEDAYRHVISSIGNVSELFPELDESAPNDKKEVETRIQKAAVIKTVSVGLYIFSIVVFFGSSILDDMINSSVNITTIGFILMLLIAIIPTCMLVYEGCMAPKYKKTEDTIVEDFKEWKNGSSNSKSIKNACISVSWTFTVLVYFAVSFFTYAWYATWIIFLAGACIHTIIELIFRLREMK